MSKIIGYEIKTPWVPMSILVDVETKPIVVGAAFLPMTKFLRKAGQKLNIADFKKDSPGDSFRGWLWTITRNEVRMHFRRKGDRPQATGGTDAQHAIQQIPDVFTSDTDPTPESAKQRLVRRALSLIRAEFQPNTWQAFWRTTVDGQPAPEIAEELSMSPGAVRQAKHRVLMRLREFLSDE